MLGEIGDAEIRFVEDLESDASGFGQAQPGHLQAQFGDLVLGRQQFGSVIGDFVVDTAFMQLLHDGAGVFGRQSRIEGLQSALALPARKPHHARHYRDRHDDDGRKLARCERSEKFLDLIHFLSLEATSFHQDSRVRPASA